MQLHKSTELALYEVIGTKFKNNICVFISSLFPMSSTGTTKQKLFLGLSLMFPWFTV